EEWVTNEFGRRLFEIFFKTYTEKVWGIGTAELSADWAAQRIKGLDLRQVITSALLPKRAVRPGDEVVKTLIDSFRYPRRGPGQLWERVAGELAEDGYPVRMGRTVRRVLRDDRGVTGVVVEDRDGRTGTIPGAAFVSTLALRDLVRALDPPPPEKVRAAADRLAYRDFLSVALILDRRHVFPDNWIYVHDPSVRVGRLQNFKNWSPEMVADPSRTCLGLEYFCFEGDGLWTSSDEDLIRLAGRELAALGLARESDVVDGTVVRQPKAYPVYDAVYQQHLGVLREWLERAVPNLFVCGRNGMHKYNNQDHSMLTALIVARRIAGVSDQDPWRVNGDAEYLEEGGAGVERGGRAVPLPTST
ncbi:MAG: FAD-dependent oxidoreductase, partial [Candidatus Dormiibacterota bacterium]